MATEPHRGPETIGCSCRSRGVRQPFHIETVPVSRFIIGMIIGGPLFGAAVGALVSVTGWNLVRRERTLDSH
ncbi:hypothetical protein DBV08_31535 [Rhodococcus sp. KBW08]|nr:hypothetical protein DBV08_31535 [Rhodococcus sp. KBW08]